MFLVFSITFLATLSTNLFQCNVKRSSMIRSFLLNISKNKLDDIRPLTKYHYCKQIDFQIKTESSTIGSWNIFSFVSFIYCNSCSRIFIILFLVFFDYRPGNPCIINSCDVFFFRLQIYLFIIAPVQFISADAIAETKFLFLALKQEIMNN